MDAPGPAPRADVDRVEGKPAEYDDDKRDLTVEFDVDHHPDLSDFVGVVVGPFGPKIDIHTIHGIHIGSPASAVRRAFGCHIHLGQCVVSRGRPGADGSTSFTVGIQNGKANQYVFNDL